MQGFGQVSCGIGSATLRQGCMTGGGGVVSSKCTVAGLVINRLGSECGHLIDSCRWPCALADR